MKYSSAKKKEIYNLNQIPGQNPYFYRINSRSKLSTPSVLWILHASWELSACLAFTYYLHGCFLICLLRRPNHFHLCQRQGLWGSSSVHEKEPFFICGEVDCVGYLEQFYKPLYFSSVTPPQRILKNNRYGRIFLCVFIFYYGITVSSFSILYFLFHANLENVCLLRQTSSENRSHCFNAVYFNAARVL